MIEVGTKQITDYGKSMYGGWYANWFDHETGKLGGEHEKTLRDLCAKLKVSRTALQRDVVRIDN